MINIIVTGERRALKDKNGRGLNVPSKYQNILRIGKFDLSKNIAKAETMNKVEFAYAVWPGHVWDYKNSDTLIKALKKEGEFDGPLLAEFGNWHYGLVASAQGMNLAAALTAAGGAQTFIQGGGNLADFTLGFAASFSISNSAASYITSLGFTWGDHADDPLPIMSGWNSYYE